MQWDVVPERDRWYHVKVEHEAPDTWRLYVDGELRATAKDSYFMPDQSRIILNHEGTVYVDDIVFSLRDSETPRLSLNIDIDTSLKQGEIRKGTLTVKNEGNADAKSVKVKLSSESLRINIEKSYDKIPVGEAREFVFEVNANDAGTFKLSAYAEYWDDEGNKYVETSEEYIHVEAVGDVTKEKSITPGFEAIFAIIGLILVTYTYLRRKKR